ncbi:response regulator [Geomonas sp. RF6]|uniref:hybrid sensor histidine kinase/response regulator n=1 Tax=Geomonas sp. RF6 TaxID=2897342 RepID=UPI001E55BF82|nr:response regulator [Geomonas sp. RF6]UFS69967.1 response regulator [Geomonas sp. RF6]
MPPLINGAPQPVEVMFQRDQVIERRWQIASCGAGVTAALIGAVFFAAWLGGEMSYRGFHTITMKTNASLCLLLTGFALALTALGRGEGRWRCAAQAMGGAAMSIGALTLLEHIFGWDLGIDQLIAQEPPGALAITAPNRMGPPGAISFAVTGAAVILLNFFARPGEGVMELVSSPGPGGIAVRRLLPAAFILPIILGWLRLKGERLGLYERYFGTSILVLSWIFVFSFIVYKTAKWVNASAVALRLNEKRYRSFVEASSQVVWRVDAAGRADQEIQEWQEYTGQTGEEARGFGWMEVLRPEDRPAVAKAWQEATETGRYEVEYLLRRRDGEWRNILARGVPIRNGSGKIVEWIGTGIDVTEQRQATAALQQKEAQFRQLAEALPQLVWVARPDGSSEYQNAKWHEYTGSDPDGSSDAGWLRFLHPDDVGRVVERWGESVRSGEPYEDEYRLRRADGEYHWFIARGLAVRNEAGEILRWLGTSTDIQDHKVARELAEAAAQAKTDFMANMSHEIRTPMNGIIGVTELLLQTELNELQRPYLQMVKGSADALLSVVNDILDFSKIEAGAAVLHDVEFDLHESVQNVAEALSVIGFQKGLEFAVAIDPEVPERFRGDPVKLRQVLMNLIGNAVKFTEHGEVAVRVEGTPAAGGAWRLLFSVRDTGIGISPEKQGLLFRSFTQLDPSASRVYGGTGLGLAISKKIVELMGGEIHVSSHPGEGSTFTFDIELIPVEDADTAKAPTAEKLSGRRALVVEDNETNRLMLERLLGSYGLQVEAVSLGGDGLARVEETKEPFDFILIDAHLPDMEGFSLAEMLKERFPVETCALLMIPSDRIAEGARRVHEIGMKTYLVKPIRGKTLLQSLVQMESPGTDEAKEGPREGGEPPLDDLLCRHILVAEDNPVNLTVTEALLRRAGARVTAATNGIEAVEACLSGSFDVVLMDVQMPEMDGFEATRALRGMGVEVPIIGLTAHALEGDRDRCVHAGMDDYLSKPVTAESLNGKVAYWSRVRGNAVADAASLLGHVGGDPETYQIVVSTFVEHAPAQMADIVAAVRAADADAVEKTAHRLKGALALVTAEAARCMAEKLEQSGKKGDLAAAGDLAAHLEAEVARVLDRLQELSKEGNPEGA